MISCYKCISLSFHIILNDLANSSHGSIYARPLALKAALSQIMTDRGFLFHRRNKDTVCLFNEGIAQSSYRPKDKTSKTSTGLNPKSCRARPTLSFRPEVLKKGYSYRNTLRNTLTVSGNHNHRDTMSSYKQSSNNIPSEDLMIERGVDDTANYDALTQDIFVTLQGNRLICLLCGKKDFARGSRPIETHLETSIHKAKFRNLENAIIEQLPGDTSLQMNAICEFLTRWIKSKALTEQMIALRVGIIEEFNYILQQLNPECTTRPFGPLVTGTSLKSSNIYLELIHPNSKLFKLDPRARDSIHQKLIDPDAGPGYQINHHTLHYDLIPNAIETLYNLYKIFNNEYREYPANSYVVTSTLKDLTGRTPTLTLCHEPDKTVLEVICYDTISYELSSLLRHYMLLDDRAYALGTLVQIWAKICKIDDPEYGTYPADVYLILVIYFLQRTKPPILPCLHEILQKPAGLSSNGKQDQNQTDKMIEQLDNLKINVSNHLDTAQEIDKSSIEDTEKPDTSEENDADVEDNESDGEEGSHLGIDDETIKSLNWKSMNDTPIHKLFIQFLLYMSREFRVPTRVISIRNLSNLSTQSKRWHCQTKAIENPVRPGQNITRCIATIRTFRYIQDCFRYGYCYLTSIPLDTRLKPKTQIYSNPSLFISLFVSNQRLRQYIKMRIATIGKSEFNAIDEMVQQGLFAKDVDTINSLFDLAQYQLGGVQYLPSAIANSYNESQMMPLDIGATRFCWLCKRHQVNHTRSTCPEGKLLNLRLEAESYDASLDTSDITNLDPHFIKVHQQSCITPAWTEQYSRVVSELTSLINSSTDLDCKLERFGSTVNNMGSIDSDLDICVTLNNNFTGRGVDCVKILEDIQQVLARATKVSSIESILTARVPILKFKYETFDVDLSMYNHCAIYNSKLLKAYSLIDKRVAQLFHLIKRYAKVGSALQTIWLFAL